MLRRQLVPVAAALLLSATAFPAVSAPPEPAASLVPAGFQALIGPLHEHSGYSDGWPGSTPKHYYDSAAAFGNDFLLTGEHSDNLDVPITANEECAGPGLTGCLVADQDPVKALTKWEAMQAYADAATTPSFTGVRGFEWTSDRFGHLNVYFSRHKTNAKADGGYASMASFWRWLAARPEVGGGLDGLATFNHPDAKKLPGVGGSDPGVNWDDFAYHPEADRQMVGLEVYNDDDHFGQWYSHVLDKGWHVGAVGAEDLGHRRKDDWGGPGWAKTVILSRDRSAPALREAMQARRFYAVRRPDVRLGFTVDHQLMGSRLARREGQALVVRASAVSTTAGTLDLDVVTSGGRVVARGTDDLTVPLKVRATDKYYFLRVSRGSEVVGYSSPVWVQQALPAPTGEWLAGDLHVHSCYSHDVYCGPGDTNTGPEDFYTAGGSPTQRFAEAAAKGLDYLALTDHNDNNHPEESGFPGSVNDPGFGGSGVIGVPAYENSIRGHAQMLGAKRVYDVGTGDEGVNAMAEALRADGGLFQANHPNDDSPVPITDCARLPAMHWGYGLRVPVDSVEVWNIGHHLQPPAPAGTSNADAIRFWECWLSTGRHVAATGGSDSHWLSTAAFQGVGNPTTWVFARERSARGVLEAVKQGRTSISVTTPLAGATVLLLEGDVDRDGIYESQVGDTVPVGTPLRVRTTGAPLGGLVDIRSNGSTVVSAAALAPGGTVEVTLTKPGWVWAQLHADSDQRAACDPLVGDRTTYCRNRVGMLGMTSALWLAGEDDCRLTAPAGRRFDEKCRDE